MLRRTFGPKREEEADVGEIDRMRSYSQFVLFKKYF
jgi:hypothetical protein